MCSVDNKYENQGKLGAAVIGSHSASDVSRYWTVSLLTLHYLWGGCLQADTQRCGHSTGPMRNPDRPQDQ